VVLRFSGAFPYNIQNVALYAYTFVSANAIPSYRLYTMYAMPADMLTLISIKIDSPQGYTDLSDYYIQGPELYVNSSLIGNIIINYFKYPDTIDVNSDPMTELEITPDAQELIPYYVAGHVYLEDNPNVATLLLNEYESKLANLLIPPSASQGGIVNGWGW
jgi:hypothetical protein